MKEFEYTVTVENGIHARPAGKLIANLKESESEVIITTDKGKKADARKLFAVMSLGVKEGDGITVKVSGRDEDQVANATQKFMMENF